MYCPFFLRHLPAEFASWLVYFDLFILFVFRPCTLVLLVIHNVIAVSNGILNGNTVHVVKDRGNIFFFSGLSTFSSRFWRRDWRAIRMTGRSCLLVTWQVSTPTSTHKAQWMFVQGNGFNREPAYFVCVPACPISRCTCHVFSGVLASANTRGIDFGETHTRNFVYVSWTHCYCWSRPWLWSGCFTGCWNYYHHSHDGKYSTLQQG